MVALQTSWILVDHPFAGLIILCFAIVGTITFFIASAQVAITYNDTFRFITHRTKSLSTPEVTNDIVKAYIKECRALLASAPDPIAVDPPPYVIVEVHQEALSSPMSGKQLPSLSSTTLSSHSNVGSLVEKA